MSSINHLKNWIFKNKWLILGTLSVFAINYFYLNQIFAIHFVDEEDNLVLGHFLLNGQKLYSDLFSHHQPLAYILSAGCQLLTAPENIFMLIKRHREFMIAWSVLWSTVLIWRFRERTIIPLIIYETSKFFLLGSLFLSESLAVYPILFLILFLLEEKKPKTLEFIIAGFSMGFSALMLAPAWPLLAAYFFLLIWIKKINLKQIIYLILAGLTPIFIALPFIDLQHYFRNVFYINFKYYIPQSGEEKLPMSGIKAFLSPITAVITPTPLESFGTILKAVAVFFVLTVAILVKTKKFKSLILIITILTLSNIRYYSPGLQYYAGFHLLIWYALFIFFSFYFVWDFTKKLNNTKLKTALVILVIAATVISIFASKQLFKKRGMDHDYYVNYSRQQAFGQAIRIMHDENDTLFVIPDDWLLYFQGDIKNNNRMVNFYGWMSLVWELNDPVVEKFKTDPPEFFYCDCDEKTVEAYSLDYTQMIRDGAKTHLWVLNSKYNSLTDTQKDQLRYFNFQF